MARGLIALGLLVASVCVLAADVQAQSTRYSGRAGSRFTAAGQTDRRPYRRRQPAAAQPVVDQAVGESDSEFDYRLDADATGEPDYLDTASYQDDVYPDDADQRVGLLHAGFCSGCDDCSCGDCVEASCGCDDSRCGLGCDVLGSTCGTYGPCSKDYYPTWLVGYESVFVKPRFSQNVAFTTFVEDLNMNMEFVDTEFNYDLQYSPRVWIGTSFNQEWAWRFTYWQYDQSPATVSASPDAVNGEISHPSFTHLDVGSTAGVDISTTVATDVFSASSELNAYTFDFEALTHTRFCRWQLGVGGGIRYASSQQSYAAELRNAANTLLGNIDYTQEIEGVGPTVSLTAQRRLAYQVNLVWAARASVLFGDGVSRLTAGEDLNLVNPFTTTRTTNREDLLPIGEARLGLEWVSPKHRRGFQWVLNSSMEGHVWGNAGSASSETADLGFFGFTFGAGIVR